jgi:hypothetical protein
MRSSGRSKRRVWFGAPVIIAYARKNMTDIIKSAHSRFSHPHYSLNPSPPFAACVECLRSMARGKRVQRKVGSKGRICWIYAYHGQIGSQVEQRSGFTNNKNTTCPCAGQGRAQGDDNVEREFLPRGRCRYTKSRAVAAYVITRRVHVQCAGEGI